MRALEVDFDPMPLAGAVERRKSRGDRADGRKENGWRPSGFRKPAGFSTTSTLNFLPAALDFWPLAKNRECRGPVELFLASIAEWDGDVLRLVMAA